VRDKVRLAFIYYCDVTMSYQRTSARVVATTIPVRHPAANGPYDYPPGQAPGDPVQGVHSPPGRGDDSFQYNPAPASYPSRPVSGSMRSSSSSSGSQRSNPTSPVSSLPPGAGYPASSLRGAPPTQFQPEGRDRRHSNPMSPASNPLSPASNPGPFQYHDQRVQAYPDSPTAGSFQYPPDSQYVGPVPTSPSPAAGPGPFQYPAEMRGASASHGGSRGGDLASGPLKSPGSYGNTTPVGVSGHGNPAPGRLPHLRLDANRRVSSYEKHWTSPAAGQVRRAVVGTIHVLYTCIELHGMPG
jgi:hypothetical protein